MSDAGLDAPSKVEATIKVELIVRALEDTLSELGIDDCQVRPVLWAAAARGATPRRSDRPVVEIARISTRPTSRGD